MHLILLSSCLLSASYPARFFHSRLFNTDLLAHFGFFSLFPPCSACYCWYCCCCCCRCLRRRRPRRLILLEHNFNFCYVANTTERTHILFLFSFFSFAVPHTASTLFYLFDLVANPSIRSMSRPPVLDSIGHLALSTSSRILEVFSTDQHLCGHFLNTSTLPRTHLIRLDSRSYLHAGANWVYPPRRRFSFFVTAADTTCLGLLVSYIQHVPTACFVTSSTASSPTPPPNNTRLCHTSDSYQFCSLALGSFSLSLTSTDSTRTVLHTGFALCTTTPPVVSTARDVVIRANGYD